jgi:hypothetical protein
MEKQFSLYDSEVSKLSTQIMVRKTRPIYIQFSLFTKFVTFIGSLKKLKYKKVDIIKMAAIRGGHEINFH